MEIFEKIILGIVQGLTEFIPVSSSGHLVLLQQLFSGTSSHLFLEFINIGTILSLLVYFRKRLISIMRDVVIERNIKLVRNIAITSIPAGLVGYLMADVIGESTFFGSVKVVITTLAIVGGIMIVLERLPKATPRTSGQDLEPWRALAIGLAQVMALVPGVSRSGATIITGRLVGLNPKSAAEYSFLASLPIMLGVAFKVFITSSDRAYLSEHWFMLAVSNAAAFIVGLAAIGFMMRYLSEHSLAVFGWYRIILATVAALVLLIQ